LVAAMAASIATIGIIGVMIYSLSGGPVMASPDAMAQFHQDNISGRMPAIPVSSLAEAGSKLSVDMPEMPAEHAMLCCMHSIKDRRMACVLLRSEGDVPVTLAVANADDLGMHHAQTVA